MASGDVIRAKPIVIAAARVPIARAGEVSKLRDVKPLVTTRHNWQARGPTREGQVIRARHLAAGCAALVVALDSWAAAAQDLGTIKVGVLEFGTVNWELDVIRHHALDKERGFTLEVQGFGSGEATNVALQGEAVDSIVDDYLWVSRQRSDGQMLTFIPFSSTVGALMVPADSGHREPRRSQGQEDRRRRRAARQELAAAPRASPPSATAWTSPPRPSRCTARRRS